MGWSRIHSSATNNALKPWHRDSWYWVIFLSSMCIWSIRFTDKLLTLHCCATHASSLFAAHVVYWLSAPTPGYCPSRVYDVWNLNTEITKRCLVHLKISLKFICIPTRYILIEETQISACCPDGSSRQSRLTVMTVMKWLFRVFLLCYIAALIVSIFQAFSAQVRTNIANTTKHRWTHKIVLQTLSWSTDMSKC